MQNASRPREDAASSRAAPSRPGGRGVYLYCLARAGAVPEILAAGIGGSGNVRTLRVGAVAAVFSRVSLGDFCGESGERTLRDPAWLVPRACQHENVIEEVMRHSPVLPVRFGAVLSSKRALANLLSGKNEEISRFLDDVSGKEEWSVRGHIEPERAAKWVLSSDPELAEQHGRLADSPGTRYFQEKRLRALTANRLKTACLTAAAQVQEELSGCAVQVCPLMAQPKYLADGDADLVFHCAFLVLRDRAAEFLGCVNSISARYAQRGILFGVSGPWPPYNFCPPISGTAG